MRVSVRSAPEDLPFANLATSLVVDVPDAVSDRPPALLSRDSRAAEALPWFAHI
jgi:hypothetical protein